MAGINAALQCRKEPPFVLGRTDAYIGVLIDDLITKGVTEPYRMFTSRCEYRLLLRHDNADLRLTEKGYRLGLIDEQRYELFKEKKRLLDAEKKKLHSIRLDPSPAVNESLARIGSAPLAKPQTLAELLKRPEVGYGDLIPILGEGKGFSPSPDKEITGEAETQIKYEGYIAKQEKSVKQISRLESRVIPNDFVYDGLANLSAEAKQKLNTIRPRTLGQASRIDGVTPADISFLTIYLENRRRR